MSGPEWPTDTLSDTPVLCQRTGGKPGVTFTSAKGEVFSVLEWAPGESLLGPGPLAPVQTPPQSPSACSLF